MTDDKQRILLTGLWQRKNKKGEVYYAGNLSYGATVLLFKNEKKNNERSPDMMLYMVGKEDQEELDYAGSEGEIPF
ncbi:unnamed protein product [marine sediment metagenome]|uniref:Uncharacterized protein n=1 Tax=marine sediment metagenome TaxID=412755 RepID=X1UWN5_9ZZZZ